MTNAIIIALLVGGFIGILGCSSLVLVNHFKEAGNYKKVETELAFTQKRLELAYEENDSKSELNDRLNKENTRLSEKVIQLNVENNRLHSYNEGLIDKINSANLT